MEKQQQLRLQYWDTEDDCTISNDEELAEAFLVVDTKCVLRITVKLKEVQPKPKPKPKTKPKCLVEELCVGYDSFLEMIGKLGSPSSFCKKAKLAIFFAFVVMFSLALLRIRTIRFFLLPVLFVCLFHFIVLAAHRLFELASQLTSPEQHEDSPMNNIHEQQKELEQKDQEIDLQKLNTFELLSRFSSEVQELSEMGFHNKIKNLQILASNNGDVFETVHVLLNQ